MWRQPGRLHPVTVARLLQQMSQGELAHKTEVSQAYISQIESGREVPDQFLQKIASVLGSPMETLFPEDNGEAFRKGLLQALKMKP